MEYHRGALDQALAAFDRATALDPNKAEPAYNRANTLRDLGRFDEALRGYDRAIALGDAINAPINKSLLLMLLGDYDQGLPLYETRWRSADPASPRRSIRRSGTARGGWPARPCCCAPNRALATACRCSATRRSSPRPAHGCWYRFRRCWSGSRAPRRGWPRCCRWTNPRPRRTSSVP
ncbi:MAG: tetratricopeptide repeat protein [Caulobacteraceae bacterium]